VKYLGSSPFNFDPKKQNQPCAFYGLKNNVLRPLSNRLDRLIVCHANITTLNLLLEETADGKT
jgi:hypothetical protein